MAPLMLMSDKLLVTSSSIVEDVYKPNTYRRTEDFAEKQLGMPRKLLVRNSLQWAPIAPNECLDVHPTRTCQPCC